MPLPVSEPDEPLGDALVLAEEVADLALADADVSGRHVGELADVGVELDHEGLAEPADLRIAPALRVEVRAALGTAHGQGGQRVLDGLLEGQELEHALVNRRVEPQAALVGTDGAAHLDPVAPVDVDLPLVVDPVHAEADHPVGLDQPLEDAWRRGSAGCGAAPARATGGPLAPPGGTRRSPGSLASTEASTSLTWRRARESVSGLAARCSLVTVLCSRLHRWVRRVLGHCSEQLSWIRTACVVPSGPLALGVTQWEAADWHRRAAQRHEPERKGPNDACARDWCRWCWNSGSPDRRQVGTLRAGGRGRPRVAAGTGRRGRCGRPVRGVQARCRQGVRDRGASAGRADHRCAERRRPPLRDAHLPGRAGRRCHLPGHGHVAVAPAPE